MQEKNIMTRYDILWINLILFLIQLSKSIEICFLLSIRYLMKLFDLTNQINEIKNIVELLLAINFKRLFLLKCLRSTNISSFTNDENFDDENFNDENSNDENSNDKIFNENVSILRLRAKIFVQTINILSHVLILFRWENSIFICLIIDFVALHMINSNEFWIAIKNLFFRLNE